VRLKNLFFVDLFTEPAKVFFPEPPGVRRAEGGSGKRRYIAINCIFLNGDNNLFSYINFKEEETGIASIPR